MVPTLYAASSLAFMSLQTISLVEATAAISTFFGTITDHG
jgi:hypothetical protein